MRDLRDMIPAVLLSAFIVNGTTSAQETSEPPAADTLALSQEQLADKYKRLEMLMLKMAEVDAQENPHRSALLKKAIAQSKNKFIKKNMDELVKVLQQQRFRNAIEGQFEVRDDLKLLLELLQSENRTDRIKSEQDRVRQYIRELQRIIRQQKSVQGRTESGESTNRISDDQKKVADRADRLAKTIVENENSQDDADQEDSEGDELPSDDGPSTDKPVDESESESDESNDEKSTDGKPSDGPDAEKSDSDGDNDQQPSDKESKKGSESEGSESEDSESESNEGEEGSDPDSKPSDANSNGKSSDQDGSPGEEGTDNDGQAGDENSSQPSKDAENPDSPSQKGSPPSDGQPNSDSDGDNSPQPPQEQDDNFPGRKRIAAAEDKMQEAAKKLDEAQRDGAIEDQEEARRLLEQAKAELEEILRQLREEEVERTLAQLESRFRKMLAMQIAVYDDTKQLAKVPSGERKKSFDIEARKQSLAERRIVEEADRAILLLLEEGSSVAFPEAAEQMRADMEDVVQRLAESKVGEMTLGLEEDIITALEEMIEALQQAQKDAEEQKQQRQQQQQQQGSPQDQPLVNAIEELKMIRALQMRVNKRTNYHAKMLSDENDLVGQVTDPDLIESLERLAGREERIRKITRDIVTGKTK